MLLDIISSSAGGLVILESACLHGKQVVGLEFKHEFSLMVLKTSLCLKGSSIACAIINGHVRCLGLVPVVVEVRHYSRSVLF